MDDIYIAPHIFELIFNYFDPIRLLKLRKVHKSWNSTINDSNVWKRLCLSDKIKPWVHQLIKLKFPILKREHYKTLANKQWREIFQLYKRWNTSFNYTENMITSWIDLPPIQVDDRLHSYCDLLGEYFAYINPSLGEVQLLNIITGDLLMEPIYLKNYLGDQLHGSVWYPYAHGIKIWLTDNGNVILVIQFNNLMFFCNAEDGRQYKTPAILSLRNRAIRHLLRGFDNDVIIDQIDDYKKMSIFKIELNDQDEITPREILNITQPSNLNYNYIKVSIENSKIFVLYHVMNSEDNTVPDYDYEENTFLAITVIKFQQSLAEPVSIYGVDNNYTLKVLRGHDMSRYDIFISNSIIIINDNRDRDGHQTMRLIWVKHFDGTKKPIGILKRYILPNEFRFQIVTSVVIFLNFLYIATDIGNIVVYKLNNMQNLLALHFDRLPMIKFPLDRSDGVHIKNLIMTQINGEPRIVVPIFGKSIYVIQIV